MFADLPTWFCAKNSWVRSFLVPYAGGAAPNTTGIFFFLRCGASTNVSPFVGELYIIEGLRAVLSAGFELINNNRFFPVAVVRPWHRLLTENLADPLIPNLLPWAGTLSMCPHSIPSVPGCFQPHPTQPIHDFNPCFSLQPWPGHSRDPRAASASLVKAPLPWKCLGHLLYPTKCFSNEEISRISHN